MSKSAILNKMADLLMLKGKSITEARNLVNHSQFAQKQQLQIEQQPLEDRHSIQALAKEMTGIKTIVEQFADHFTKYDNFAQQAMALKQRRVLLRSGWDVFKGFKTSSVVYLLLLTIIVFILQIYVLPSFSEMFFHSGVELPYLTRLFFTDKYLAIVVLVLIWIAAVSYLIIIGAISRHIQKFALLPSWYFKLPVLGPICHLVNQCILLSLYNFLVFRKGFILPDAKTWHQRFNLSTNNKCYPWANDIYEHLKLSLELNIANEYLVDELDSICEQYVDKTVYSIKLFSLIVSIALAIFIGSTVIAMYLPLFMMGSVI